MGRDDGEKETKRRRHRHDRGSKGSRDASPSTASSDSDSSASPSSYSSPCRSLEPRSRSSRRSSKRKKSSSSHRRRCSHKSSGRSRSSRDEDRRRRDADESSSSGSEDSDRDKVAREIVRDILWEFPAVATELRQMDGNMEDLAKKGQQGLLLLAELSQQAAIIGEMGNQYTDKYLNKGQYRSTPETGLQWVLRCMSRPRYFYKMFRMSTDVFMALHEFLISNYGLTSSTNVSSIESLAMFLWIVGGPESFSQAENRFTRSLWTVHTKFHEVLLCLRKLARDNIKPRDPNFTTEHERVKEDRFWPYFKGAIGAIDGSHVPVVVPTEEVVSHTCRHGYTSQNVLAVCDFDMRFIFVVAGWPGSAYDTRILHHALANFPSFPVPPKGKYYLVDSGYPNRQGYLAPFKGSTYHILEFRLRNGRPPQGKYEMFNFLHSSLRNVIERSFGVLKQKWRILKQIPSYPTRTQKHIILACMALHNFIRDSQLRDREFDKCDDNDEYLLQQPSAMAQTQGDDIEDEENEETMNTIRSRIADALVSARGR